MQFRYEYCQLVDCDGYNHGRTNQTPNYVSLRELQQLKEDYEDIIDEVTWDLDSNPVDEDFYRLPSICQCYKCELRACTDPRVAELNTAYAGWACTCNYTPC